ncbi:hypothetical protein GXW77_21230, partial [Roseomonas alkaliterrae]
MPHTVTPPMGRRILLGLGLLALAGPRPATAGTVTEAALARAGPALRLALAVQGEQSWAIHAESGPDRLLLRLPGAHWR